MDVGVAVQLCKVCAQHVWESGSRARRGGGPVGLMEQGSRCVGGAEGMEGARRAGPEAGVGGIEAGERP